MTLESETKKAEKYKEYPAKAEAVQWVFSNTSTSTSQQSSETPTTPVKMQYSLPYSIGEQPKKARQERTWHIYQWQKSSKRARERPRTTRPSVWQSSRKKKEQRSGPSSYIARIKRGCAVEKREVCAACTRQQRQKKKKGGGPCGRQERGVRAACTKQQRQEKGVCAFKISVPLTQTMGVKRREKCRI